MTSYLRPTVSLGVWSKENHGYYGFQSLVRWRNRELFTASRTPYVRMWVAWPYLQPKDASDPATNTVHKVPYPDPWTVGVNASLYDQPGNEAHVWTNMTPQRYLFHLDDTIIQARRAGLKIILTLFLTPYWANAARRNNNYNEANPYYCPPNTANPGSPWANIAAYLLTRYCGLSNDPRFGGYAGRWRWIDFFEVCNEPNGQWWPQSDTTNDQRGVRRLPDLAAEMMATARGITGAAGQPIILGPATSDGDSGTPYSTFTSRMLQWFWNNGFREDRSIGWSHHNYKDIEVPRAGTSSSTSVINGQLDAYVSRSQIPGRGWRGWGGDDTNPGQIFLTEGGARRELLGTSASEATKDSWQNDKINNHWDRLIQSGPGDAGRGVASICNYLMWSFKTDRFDTGLCKLNEFWTEQPGYLGREYALPADASRPVFNTWKNKFTNAPRDTVVGYRQWYSLGGYCNSGPDVMSLYPGHLDVFVVGGDAKLYHKWYVNGWSGWHSLDGYCTSDPAAVSMHSDRADVFVRSSDNNIWQAIMRPGGNWDRYYYMGSPPGGATSAPDVLSQAPGQLELFVRGGDGGLWHNWMYGYGGWSGWHPMGGGQIAFDPAAVSWGNGRMDVFATHPSNTKLMWWWWQSDSGWHGPTDIYGPQMLEDSPERHDAMKTQPALIGGCDAASQEPGQLELFVRGLDEYSNRGWVSNVWRMEYTPSNAAYVQNSNGTVDGPWTGWEWIGAPRVAGDGYSRATSDPSAVSWYRNHTQVFVRGNDNACWTMHQGFA